MKRFYMFCLCVLILLGTVSTFACATVEYDRQRISVTLAENGKIKILRTVNSGNIGVVLLPPGDVTVCDSFKIYIDVSNYADSVPARGHMMLPFDFVAVSGDTEYYYKARRDQLAGRSVKSNNTFNFSASGVYDYGFCGDICVSSSAFVSVNNVALELGAKIDCFKIIAYPTVMSDFYFILGDVYAVRNDKYYRISDFSQFSLTTSQPHSQYTTAVTNAPNTATGAASFTDGNTNTSSTAVQPSENTAATKFVGSGKSYIIRTEKPNSVTKSGLAPEDTDNRTDQGNSSTTNKARINIYNDSGNILPFAGAAIFTAVVVAGMVIMRRGTKTATDKAQTAEKQSEVKDEEL